MQSISEIHDLFKFIQEKYNIGLKGIFLSGRQKFMHCWTTIEKLQKSKIKNWELNRPPDNERSKEISEYIKAQLCVDGTIYLAYISTEDQLICYDGSHRLLAINLLDLNQTQYEIPIMISVLINATKGDMIDHFEILNKCIPLPVMYHDGADINKKTAIIDTVNYLMDRYSVFFKPSRNPNVPHENRDRLNDKINELYTQYDLTNKDSIMSLLFKINDKIKNNIPNKAPQKAIDKCKKYDFYIFLNKFWDKEYYEL